MEHRFLLVHQMDKVKVAAAITAGVERTLVFVRTKRGADRLVTQLEREGVQRRARSTATSARARASGRSRTSSSGKLPVLVATDVAARGIHVDGSRRRRPLRPGRGRQGLPAPLGSHGPRRRERASRSRSMLWNQENEVRLVQRRLGLTQPIVEVFSNDPRLADLHAWDPAGEAVPA